MIFKPSYKHARRHIALPSPCNCSMKNLFTVFLLVSTSLLLDAQTLTDSLPGDITIHASSKIDSLETKLRGKTELKGYRIQVFMGSFADAKKERNNFINLGLGISTYLPQNPPDYSLRVGDFRTQMEASKYLEKIRIHYPDAFIVPDRVEPPRFPKRP